MSRNGLGPVLTILLIGSAVGAHYFWFPTFSIAGIPDDLLLSIGIGLGALGVYVFALTGTRIIRERVRREPPGKRPAFVFRYPLNGAMVLFIVPGLSFLLGSWLPFFCSPLLFLVYRRLRRMESAEDGSANAGLQYR